MLDIYESGLRYRALRIETSGDAGLCELISLFQVTASGGVMKAGATTLSVVVSDQPPWRIAEQPGGVITWTVSPSKAADILNRIDHVNAHPPREMLLNEEDEDLVVELVHHPG